MSKTIRISEIFGPTIQGEGPLIGQPTVFVRTGGCDYRCAWCDTLYAVLPEHRDEWIAMTPEAILTQIETLAGGEPVLVTISGGNPALQPMEALIAAGRVRGHRFAMETQGSIAQPWFAELDWLVMSPKPPSSLTPTGAETVEACLAAAEGKPQVALKIVVFDDADYAYARDMAARFPALPLYLQVGNPAPLAVAGEAADMDDLMRRFRWLIDKVVADRWFSARVLPQLHVLAWGNKRGV